MQSTKSSSCELCAVWGPVTARGLCPGCRDGHYRVAQGLLHDDACRRCGWSAVVGADGTCRGCRVALRLGEDEEWMRAEIEGRALPSGRPLQLALHIDGVRLSSFPLHHSRTGRRVRERLPLRSRVPVPAVRDDPSVCVEEVPGQLGLFPPWPRSFTREHGHRIRGRRMPGLPHLLAVLEEMAAERGVGETWMFHTGDCARLALASRPPDEDLVRPEALADLPQMRPTLLEALGRAGLLARRRPRLVPSWTSRGHGSCRECLAWTNDRDQRCAPCLSWGMDRAAGACHRCGRVVPLRDDHCRRCVLFLAETHYDLDGVALNGGDQLWFGGPFAPHLRVAPNRSGEQDGLYGRRRLQAKRRTAVQTSRAARPVSPHLALPGQLELFPLARDWSRVDERRLPALTPSAKEVLDGFVAHIRERGWKRRALSTSIRTLRVLVAHLGAETPLREEDVRLLSRRQDFNGARVVNYLRVTGRLVPDRRSDAASARARRLADMAPQPFCAAVHRWIDVLSGQAARPSVPLAPTTVCAYVRRVSPCLRAWYEAGIGDLRAVTGEHVQQTLKALKGEEAKSLATPLRSLFRALKREKLIFRDPTRSIVLSGSRRLPVPLPDNHLHGVLDQLPEARNQLSFVLAAVHALSGHDQRGLLLDDVDRSRGRLTVRRPGRLHHTVYLDEVTFRLLTRWMTERHRRWPTTTNPHLLVTARTATDDSHPQVNPQAITKALHRLGLQITSLRVDRILDEAKHTRDPVHLIRLFGLSPVTAMKYLRAAHPAGTRPDPLSG
ncbi:hypothetical protein [Streptomyces mirabilis]